MTLRKVNRYYLLVLSTYSTSHSFIRPDTSARSNQILSKIRKERKVLEEQACPALGRYLMIFADIEEQACPALGRYLMISLHRRTRKAKSLFFSI